MSLRKRIVLSDGETLPGGRYRYKSKQDKKFSTNSKILLITLCGIIGVYIGKNLFFKNIKAVNEPFNYDLNNGFIEDKTKFWGTYRPQVYMGMKTKSKRSLVSGLMWLRQHVNYGSRELPIKHTCEHGDQLKRYGWLSHDGTNFGIQSIVDKDYELKTEFVKTFGGLHGGDWTWRISGSSTSHRPIYLSIFFYVATDGQGEIRPVYKKINNEMQLVEIKGSTEELGSFTIKLPRESTGKSCRYHTAISKAEGLHKINDAILRRMHRSEEGVSGGQKKPYYFISQNDRLGDPPKSNSDVIFHQVSMELPFEIEIIFESDSFTDRSDFLSGWKFTEKLNKYKKEFDEKFETIFPLKSKGYKEEEITFAKAAFSNMIGGIGHFYGQSLVQSEDLKKPIPYWPAELLTAVPSRSFFPRGFLWDEGFHQMLISKWDKRLSMEIIEHWLNMINHEGWIPREQILGDEARSKVPDQFVVQRNTNANPPTLFLAIESIVDGLDKTSSTISSTNVDFLSRIYPRLKAWFNWFNTTQAGPVPFSYRWRGRNADTDEELNPKTLTSGLDDYPRASHPSNDERHIDLRCWIALGSLTMSKIAKILNKNDDERAYRETHQSLIDSELLDKLHWNSDLGVFSDWGNHSSRVQLQMKNFRSAQPGQPYVTRVVRVTRREPKLGFVDTFGYVSLFPLLLKQLSPHSNRLLQMLQDLPQEDLLWTKYGLRSLSARDPLYMKRNTQHDPPYWRGQIWININYLAVRALRHYSKQDGPHRRLAAELYAKLRTNIVKNLFDNYSNSGFLWEQYNDGSGKGQGTHPFTGWSALVVLMMAEEY